ncbi:MarR family winged helix-turn-helix transcriptional regulator [Marinicellulosiphila megalodicopiae]|uniref:MarR family winged helix-turn-helix transcriptional regulator n=1 Tax=Marinicellulosiphila megalodicopiae TaxID=2724896 RepID=UPI003BB08805
MKKDETDNQVFEYFRAIHIIQQLSKEKVESVLPKSMLMSHFNVLAHLSRHNDTQTPAMLASAFQVTRPSMSNTLSKLENMKYIKILSDPHDGRSKKVQLTAFGEKSFQLAIQNIGPVFESMIKEVGMTVFENSLPDLKKISMYLDSNR